MLAYYSGSRGQHYVMATERVVHEFPKMYNLTVKYAIYKPQLQLKRPWMKGKFPESKVRGFATDEPWAKGLLG